MGENQIPITAGVLIMLGLIGSVYYIDNLENTYFCEDKQIVTQCYKLSIPNGEISTRCYYNETIPKNYYVCSSGWKLAKDSLNESFLGNPIEDKSEDEQIYTAEELLENESTIVDYELNKVIIEEESKIAIDTKVPIILSGPKIISITINGAEVQVKKSNTECIDGICKFSLYGYDIIQKEYTFPMAK